MTTRIDEICPRRVFPIAIRLELARIAMRIPRAEFERMTVREYAARRAEYLRSTARPRLQLVRGAA